jgi:DNA (cytosine-5)-methyltransferase 1
MGYHRAGYRVIGVDLSPQPHYPFEFMQADMMHVLADLAAGRPIPGKPMPVAIHVSAPCQGYSQMSRCHPGLAGTYAKLVADAKAALIAIGLPWLMENVPGSGLAAQDDLFGAMGTMLCGGMFRLPLYRHRLFEASFHLHAPGHPRHLIPASKAGHWEPGTIMSVAGNCTPVAVAKVAMGIDWMPRRILSQAIPPAYTEHLGGLLTAHLAAVAA